MANLTITVCRPVEVREKFTGPAAEVIALGQYVRYNTTNGKIELGNGTSTTENRKGGIALSTVAAGETVTAVKKGILDIGNALSSYAYDADIFVSDTDGTLASSAGTASQIMGTIVPGWASGATADKLLRVEL